MKQNKQTQTNKTGGQSNKENTAANGNARSTANQSEEQEYVQDTDPPLTEQDLEENHLSEEEADKIEWDNPRTD
jgi:hypothetical protein